ncbi:MAG: nucleotidyl transferase [Ferruginibacter sp.]|nr:nucleotidyl transferase [Ferruginibacter sp.]
MKAMILAAGLGTRLKPFTDKHPKALAPVNGKTLLQRNIEYLKSYGYDEIIVNVHHFADQIIDLVNQQNGWGAKITISDETSAVLETGGGIKNAENFFVNCSQPFLVMNADILTDLDLDQMRDYHAARSPLATLAVTHRNTSRYLLFDENLKLCGWKNEKTGEQTGQPGKPFAFSGIHLISPEIFPLISEQGKFSVIDLYVRLAASETIIGFDHSNSLLMDVGKPESLTAAEKIFS